MKNQGIFAFILLISFFVSAQKPIKSDLLYKDQTPLSIKLNYSNKEVNAKTDDSAYIKTNMEFLHEEKWSSIELRIRARGNFRRSECYFPPIKMKIKKDQYKGTIFDGNKTMKLVLPCKLESENNDNILQEFIAYKIYENISPYHFKTKRVNIDFTEQRGKKTKNFQLKGFLIEDDKRIAKRHEGRVFERFVHPMGMDHTTSVHVALFQFLLGNTDFSTAYQHNGKLLYSDKKIIPLPYDFDMSGLVDPSYAVANEALGLRDIQDRAYRGFKRDEALMNDVRSQFLNNKGAFFAIIDGFKTQFDNPKEHQEVVDYIASFFDVIESDKLFQSKIMDKMRTK